MNRTLSVRPVVTAAVLYRIISFNRSRVLPWAKLTLLNPSPPRDVSNRPKRRKQVYVVLNTSRAPTTTTGSKQHSNDFQGYYTAWCMLRTAFGPEISPWVQLDYLIRSMFVLGDAFLGGGWLKKNRWLILRRQLMLCLRDNKYDLVLNAGVQSYTP